MALQYVPMKEISARYAQGWRLAQPLDPNDYAALMRPPGSAESNKHLAAVARNNIRYGIAAGDEVDRLRDQIAQMTGAKDVERVMRTFGISAAKAQILLLLINRGIASHETILNMIYDDDEMVEIENPVGAIRDHVKRLRPALKKHGITFDTSYGYGFEMSEDMRAKAKAVLAGVPA